MAGSGVRGRFIVLDGIDGCGKSTQARLLVEALAREAPRAPLHLREPGSTPLGERVRELLLSRELRPSAGVEALLVTAARRALLEERVGPALALGTDVVCERFHPSTFAYQAVAGGLDEEAVLSLVRTWAGTPEPDLVVLLELPEEEAARRRGAPADRIEDRDESFQRRVAEGFRRYADPSARVRRIDATAAVGEVHARILEALGRAR